MKFTFLTLFPSMFESYFEESILSRAKESKLIELNSRPIIIISALLLTILHKRGR